MIILSLVGCVKNQNKLTSQIQLLKKENDSLSKIIEELNQKYIFDDIKADFTPSKDNILKIGKEYNGSFFLIGHNESDYVLFSTKLKKNRIDLLNPDTLRTNNNSGSFKFKRMLDSTINYFHFRVHLGNKYGNDGEYLPLLTMSQGAE